MYTDPLNKSDVIVNRVLRAGSFKSLQGYNDQYSESFNDSHFDDYVPSKNKKGDVYLNNPKEKVTMNLKKRDQDEVIYMGKTSCVTDMYNVSPRNNRSQNTSIIQDGNESF